MTILTPDHIEQRFTWHQMYVDDINDEHIAFNSFDIVARDSISRKDYPCRYSSCDQFCRDSDHLKMPSEIVIDGGDTGNFICSCLRNYNQIIIAVLIAALVICYTCCRKNDYR